MNTKGKLKSTLSLLLLLAMIAFLIVLWSMKGKMNQYISENLQKSNSQEQISQAAAFVDSAFNYAENALPHQLTFLEFGAMGCVSCRTMEGVMKQVKSLYPQKVNVVFMNALQPESQLLMKYYGIAAIPTQILLDREGKEYFRHDGVISVEDLGKEFQRKGVSLKGR